MFKKIFLISLFSIGSLAALPDGYSIELFVKDIAPYLPFVAEQRINAYREYPYLYAGKMEEEIAYLEWFSQLKHSAIVIAFYNDEPVGFITGTALTAFDQHYKGSIDLFKNAGLAFDSYYYLSDAIVVPEHRNKSLISSMAQLMEEHADILGYTSVCFVCESHESHPLKPVNHKSLDSLFKRNGYSKTGMVVTYHWQTRNVDGSIKEQNHAMNYWVKNLPAVEVAG